MTENFVYAPVIDIDKLITGVNYQYLMECDDIAHMMFDTPVPWNKYVYYTFLSDEEASYRDTVIYCINTYLKDIFPNAKGCLVRL